MTLYNFSPRSFTAFQDITIRPFNDLYRRPRHYTTIQCPLTPSKHFTSIQRSLPPSKQFYTTIQWSLIPSKHLRPFNDLYRRPRHSYDHTMRYTTVQTIYDHTMVSNTVHTLYDHSKISTAVQDTIRPYNAL